MQPLRFSLAALSICLIFITTTPVSGQTEDDDRIDQLSQQLRVLQAQLELTQASLESTRKELKENQEAATKLRVENERLKKILEAYRIDLDAELPEREVKNAEVRDENLNLTTDNDKFVAAYNELVRSMNRIRLSENSSLQKRHDWHDAQKVFETKIRGLRVTITAQIDDFHYSNTNSSATLRLSNVQIKTDSDKIGDKSFTNVRPFALILNEPQALAIKPGAEFELTGRIYSDFDLSKPLAQQPQRSTPPNSLKLQRFLFHMGVVDNLPPVPNLYMDEKSILRVDGVIRRWR